MSASLRIRSTAMPTAHCVSTTEGVITEVDQGFLELTRRTESELLGASYRSITFPEDLGRSAKMLESLIKRAPPVRLQKRYVRPDGSVVAANVYVTKFDNPERLVSTLFWNESGRPLPPAKLWEAALRVRHMHSSRVREFGTDLSTDPIGAMLIAIYLAEAEGRLIGDTQLASDAALAQTTVNRWLQVLQWKGIVCNLAQADTDIQFTPDGLAKMERFLASAYDVPLMAFGAASEGV